jgi:hypothetical protein
MAAHATMRMMGGPSMAIVEAIMGGGGSARTKQSKGDAPPQAWTIHPLLGLHAPPPPTGGTHREIVVNVVTGGMGVCLATIRACSWDSVIHHVKEGQ